MLDLAIVGEGSSHHEALTNSVELAQVVERLGYHRHWVAEHHNIPGIASSSPPVLGARGREDETLRVGSGGVMLPNHPPLVVAEQFGMLESLYPGRIDLGIGRAPGTDQITASALRRSADPLSDEDFPRQLAELIGFFKGEFSPRDPYRHVKAVPGAGDMPDIWLLGSSGYSAQLAGMLGLPFAFAHHFMPRNTDAAVELYRKHFRPREYLQEPLRDRRRAAIAARTTTRRGRVTSPDRRGCWRDCVREADALSQLLRRPRRTSSPPDEEASVRRLVRLGGDRRLPRRSVRSSTSSPGAQRRRADDYDDGP